MLVIAGRMRLRESGPEETVRAGSAVAAATSRAASNTDLRSISMTG